MAGKIGGDCQGEMGTVGGKSCPMKKDRAIERISGIIQKWSISF
jgi:hypothetical protein